MHFLHQAETQNVDCSGTWCERTSEGEHAMAGPDFDSIKHLNPYNVEYWEARELMPLLGYGNKWQNFVDVIKKAMISCETTGNIVTDHFSA